MARPTRRVRPVDYDIRFPCYAEPILAKDLRYLPDERILWVNTPDGPMSFTESDTVSLCSRDLNVPEVLHQVMKRDGWEQTSMDQFILQVFLDFLREH